MLTAVTRAVVAAATSSGWLTEARDVFDFPKTFDADAGAGVVAQQRLVTAREAHAFRGSGGNDIARIKRVEGGTEGDELGHGEDEIISVVILAHVAVDARPKPCGFARGPFISRGQPWSKSSGAVEGFAGVELRLSLIHI